MPARMTITGLYGVRSGLRALARTAPAVVAPALVRALGPLEDTIRDTMPVVSGEMKAHLEIRQLPSRRGMARAEVTIRDVEYAAHVDLGTAETEAEEFMERAYDDEAKRAARSAEDEIRRALG